MFASKSKFFAYLAGFFLLILNLYPLSAVQAKTINMGTASDVVSIPGTLLNGNLQSTGSVTFSGPIYAGGGNRMITVDNAGVLGAAAIPTDTDIYWNGSTGGAFNAATARTSLGLGSLATLSSVGNSQIADVAWSKITGFPTACSAGQYVSAVGGTLTCSTPAGGISGSGTANYVSKWTGGSALGNSTIYDNGTNVGVNNTNPGAKLQINAATSNEGLRIVSASDWSPLNIRNSANSTDIFRVDQAGILQVGTIPAARVSGTVSSATTASTASTATALAANGANCSAGYYPLGVDASGASESCTLVPTASDIYWTGTATNLVPATARTSLGLGSLATLSSVSNAQINDVAWSKITGFPTACSAGQYVSAVGGTLTCSTPTDTNTDIYWTGTATNLVPATARTSLGLGSLATLSAVTTTQISDGTIVDDDISSSAAIAASKIQNGTYFITSAGTSGQVWTSDGSGAGIWSDNSGVTGGGTVGLVPYWDATKNLADSNIYYDYDNIGIGVAPSAKLDVNGSLRTNSSVTFSALGSGGTRIVTVDNSGTLGAVTNPIPSGTASQTLRNSGGTWAASSFLWNSGSTVGINYAQNACDAAIKLAVDGIIETTGLKIDSALPTEPSHCALSGNISFHSGVMQFSTDGGTGFTFNNPISVTGRINATTGFAYNGTAGLDASFAANTVLTGVNVWGGIITAATGVTGLTGTVAVRNASNTGSCNLVFTKGILTSETCP